MSNTVLVVGIELLLSQKTINVLWRGEVLVQVLEPFKVLASSCLWCCIRQVYTIVVVVLVCTISTGTRMQVGWKCTNAWIIPKTTDTSYSLRHGYYCPTSCMVRLNRRYTRSRLIVLVLDGTNIGSIKRSEIESMADLSLSLSKMTADSNDLSTSTVAVDIYDGFSLIQQSTSKQPLANGTSSSDQEQQKLQSERDTDSEIERHALQRRRKQATSDAFHEDMCRVLLSRQYNFLNYLNTFIRDNRTNAVPIDMSLQSSTSNSANTVFTTIGTSTINVDSAMIPFLAMCRQQRRYNKYNRCTPDISTVPITSIAAITKTNVSTNGRDIRWERRNKPIVLDSDLDGAGRVLTMLRHLHRIGAATETSYQIVMNAFLNRGRLRWASEYTTMSTTSQPSNNTETSKTVTTIWCAADQLEDLLFKEMIPLLTFTPDEISTTKESSTPYQPTISLRTFNLVLEAYAVCSTPRGDRNYADRANKLFQQYVQPLYDVTDRRDNDSEYIQSMMHLCHVYSWQQANLQSDDQSAEIAHTWLQKIQQLTNDTNILLQCHDWVIEAWSKSASPNSAIRADQLLQSVKSIVTFQQQQYESFEVADTDSTISRSILTAEMYSNAILAWCKEQNNINAAHRAQELLEEMIKFYKAGKLAEGSEPPLIAFNGVITIWGRVGRPDQAERVVWLLLDLQNQCNRLAPDSVSFNTVIHGYLKSRDKKQALQKAMALVHYMEDNYVYKPRIRPNCFTYNTLLKCWIQSSNGPELAEEAEKILMTMERLWEQGDNSVTPSNRIFNMVINAYAKSGHCDAAEKAYNLLQRMKTNSHTDDADTEMTETSRHNNSYNRRQQSRNRRKPNFALCRPDIISYTSAIECASKSLDPKSPILAEHLLQEVTELYELTKDKSLMPNLRTFTMTIRTLANHNGSPTRARALLEQLLDQYDKTSHPDLVPNTFPYNYVLNCAANTFGDKVEAFKIATRTYQDMRKSSVVKPDTFTYAFWIKCCHNLLQDGSEIKTKCISYAFQECKKEGLVSNEVLTRLFQGSPVWLINELLELPINVSAPVHAPIPAKFSKSTSTKHRGTGAQRDDVSIPSYRTINVNSLDRSWSCNVHKR